MHWERLEREIPMHAWPTSIRSMAQWSSLAAAFFMASVAGAADSPQDVHQLRVFYNVGTQQEPGGERNPSLRTDWASMIDVGGVPMDHKIVVLYQQDLGYVAQLGPEGTANNPSALQVHLAKVRRDLDRLIPDVNFSGVAVIDYETWNLIWDCSSQSVQNGWTTYVQGVQPNSDRGPHGGRPSRRPALDVRAGREGLRSIHDHGVQSSPPTGQGGAYSTTPPRMAERPPRMTFLESLSARCSEGAMTGWRGCGRRVDVITPTLYASFQTSSPTARPTTGSSARSSSSMTSSTR